jgi:glycosyltransferase involved in cell wall biosynthesis
MAMKKKVLYIITKATWGGAQRYVYDLATHLPKDSFDVAVAYGEKGKLAADLAAVHMRTIQLPSLGRDVALVSDVKSFLEIRKLLRAEAPDVVHLNSSKAAALGALAARLTGVKKIIFTVHGWPFKEQRNFFSTFVIRFVSWLTAVLSTNTIAVSSADQAIGIRMWGLGKKVHYIPTRIQPPQYLSREAASASLLIKTAAPKVITIGELTPNKGIRYAIEAIALLKKLNVDVEYFIIGDGEEREFLQNYVRDRNVSDRIHFLGFVPEAAKYLRAFDAFVLPSIKEGAPYVLLEARAAGLAIVATDAVDSVAATNTFLVPRANSQLLAEAIQQIVKSRISHEPYNSFPLERMVLDTISLY